MIVEKAIKKKITGWQDGQDEERKDSLPILTILLFFLI